jgi:3-phosphoshikimate 1-carboxyvinyltransferase
MFEIKSGKIKNPTVVVPGSKSYTHRMLIAAALSNGPCMIRNPLESEDTLLTLHCLRQMGISIQPAEQGFSVAGRNGRIDSPQTPVDLGNSGTSMRLLSAVGALGTGTTILTGSRRLQQRPVHHLLEALQNLGADVRAVNADGCPPVEIRGGTFRGGMTDLNCSVSSQFLSALLLVATFAEHDVDIRIKAGLVSRPYVDMTLDVMRRFGVDVDHSGYERFQIRHGQTYRSGDYTVEPDYSQAGYFWAAAAITGAEIKVKDTTHRTAQGDVHLLDGLEAMGCWIREDRDGIAVAGRPLKGIRIDMADMPDMVPTLGVVAAYAEGRTEILNVGHLRVKESDRIASVATELRKMGVAVQEAKNSLQIEGGTPHAADIETYDDHRIAMSFALAGLKTPGVKIKDPMCVKKSFPDFWEVFSGLTAE